MTFSKNIDEEENIYSDYLSVTLLRMDFTMHVLERTNGSLQSNNLQKGSECTRRYIRWGPLWQ